MSGFRSISSIFDDTIFNLFGFPFEEIFTIPSAENYSYLKKSISNNGDNYTMIKKGEKTNLYHNGRLVKESDIPEKAMYQLKNSLALKVRPNVFLPEGCNNKLPAELVSGTEFPWMDWYGKEDGGMLLKFGLTDVDEDRVSIDFDDDYLSIHIDPKAETEEEIKQAVFVKGIKDVSGEYYKSVFIDPKKYNIKTLKHWFKNGCLWVSIDKTEKPSTKISFKVSAKQEEKPESKEKKSLFSKKEDKSAE